MKLLFNNQPNNLIPIMLRHWHSHCAIPNAVVYTTFDVIAGCQLLSNYKDHLILNIHFNCNKNEEVFSLRKFKELQCYNLFQNYNNEIYELNFGGLTDAAIHITSTILHEVFNLNLDKKIKIREFNSYIP